MASATPDEDAEREALSLPDDESATDDPDLDTLLGEVVDGELSPETRKRVSAIIAQHRGPLPPPAMLKEYGEVVPGLEKLIVEQWTSETTHRRKQENELRRAFIRSEVLGQLFGFLLGLLTLAVAAYAISEDQAGPGIAALLVGGGVLVGTAVWRHRANGDDE